MRNIPWRFTNPDPEDKAIRFKVVTEGFYEGCSVVHGPRVLTSAQHTVAWWFLGRVPKPYC